MGVLTVSLKNYKALEEKIMAIHKGSETVIKRTVSDFKSRAPGWIASAVTSVYNIKKTEVMGAKKNAQSVGKIKVSGVLVDNVQIEFSGRLLTPVHFGMKPKSPPPGRSYTLKMQVFKGRQKVIGRYYNTRTPGGPFSERSHNILMHTGAKTADKVQYIPFQRMSRDRNDLKKFTTISIPQMITNENVSQLIQQKIEEGLSSRLEHHLKRELGRK